MCIDLGRRYGQLATEVLIIFNSNVIEKCVFLNKYGNQNHIYEAERIQ